MPTIKLNKHNIDSIKNPTSGQVLYWDEELKGFGLRVTPGSKMYIVQGRDRHGKDCRTKIGAHGPYTADQARKEAKQMLGKISSGANLNRDKAKDRDRGITLGELFDKYKDSRTFRPETLKGYEGVMRRCFFTDVAGSSAEFSQDWSNRPIRDISRKMVLDRFRFLSEANGPRGKGEAQANLAMRVLRSLYNYASIDTEGADAAVIDNPVKRISQEKAWNRVSRRQTVIQKHQLKDWFVAVDKLKKKDGDSLMRDYLVVLMLTGLRRNEAAKLRWADIDFKAETLRIPAEIAKNHEEHRLPLSDYLTELLQARFNRRDLGDIYVFPGDGATGHLIESKTSIGAMIKLLHEQQKTRDPDADIRDVKFSPHDLRRTFITVAEGLQISPYSLKKLLNHKNESDVTSGYIITSVEQLRESMQQITDYILIEAGLRKPKEEDVNKKTPPSE